MRLRTSTIPTSSTTTASPDTRTPNNAACTGAKAVLEYQFELRCASLAAHRPYAAGEPLRDSHGPGLSPGDLALDYGHVTHGPIADAVQMLLGEAAAHAGADASTITISSNGDGHGSESGSVEVVTTLPKRRGRHRVDAPAAAAAPPRGPRNTALLAALAAIQLQGSSSSADGSTEGAESAAPLLALGSRGPDASSLAMARAARASDAELIRAGVCRAGVVPVKKAAEQIDELCPCRNMLAMKP